MVQNRTEQISCGLIGMNISNFTRDDPLHLALELARADQHVAAMALVALCVLGLVGGASAGCVVDGDITCYTDVESRILDPNNVSACE